MKLDATPRHIRALIELAAADAKTDQPDTGARRAKRDTLARRVPRRLLEPYELLFEAGRVPAVVPIERGGCSGCHLRLPTMLEYKTHHSPAIHRCPRCHRMLYAPELVLMDAGGLDPTSSREGEVVPRGRQS